MQKAVRDWELPFTESREGHQEASKYAHCPHTGRVVQTPGLQASIGLEISVSRELLGEFEDAWGCLERCRDCCQILAWRSLKARSWFERLVTG